MSNHDNESNTEQQDLEHYLKGNSELSTLYQSSGTNKTELPGSDLDAAILAAAKKEVGSRPQTVKTKFMSFSPFSATYLIPLSTAATILVAVGLLSSFPEQRDISFDADLAYQPNKSVSSETSSIMDEQHLITELAPERKRDSLLVATPEYSSPSLIVKPVTQVPIKSKQHLSKSMAHTKPSEKRKNKENVLMQTRVADNVLSDSQQKMNRAIVAIQGNVIANSTKGSNVITYDESQWKNLTALQWRQRLLKLVQSGDTLQAQKIITIYNKKFPDLKLDINDIKKELKQSKN